MTHREPAMPTPLPVVSPSLDALTVFDLRLPYLNIGAMQSHSEIMSDELPVFSINEQGIGQANDTTASAISAHIQRAALAAASAYGSALRSIANYNAVLRKADINQRSFTVGLEQHTTIDKSGHVQTFLKLKVTRRT